MIADRQARLRQVVRWWWHRIFGPRGRHRTLNENHRVGKWAVRYDDGQHSGRMCLDTATSYATMLGGKVVWRGTTGGDER